LLAEDGYPAFPALDRADPAVAGIDGAPRLVMRHPVLLPGESEPTLIDLVLSGRDSVFVEVKLAEARRRLAAGRFMQGSQEGKA